MPQTVNMIVGDGSNRNPYDYYPTPAVVLYSLLAVERDHLPETIWEPACGDGAISKVLEEEGFKVHSTDLIERGYGEGNRDFLAILRAPYKAIITNPPFNLAGDFIKHSLGVLKVEYLALLLKGAFWHVARNKPIFDAYPPAVVYPMTFRPSFVAGKNSSPMEFQWTVWRDHSRETVYRPLSRAKEK